MNIVVYMDEQAYTRPDDSSRYLCDTLTERGVNVHVCFEEDLQPTQEADAVFYRFDLPLRTTFLEQLREIEIPRINSPYSLLNYAASKRYLLDFPELIPPTIVTENLDELLDFCIDEGNTVVKPSHTDKGEGIQRIDTSQQTRNEVASLLQAYEGEVVGQTYLDHVQQWGDKRVTLIFFEPVSCVHRYPGNGSFICNYSAGGSVKPGTLTPRDYEIIDHITPWLIEQGVYWAGVDIIGPYLGEINVGSSGLFKKGDEYAGKAAGVEALLRGLS